MMKVSAGRYVFKGINLLFMLFICAIILFPFMHILALSFSKSSAAVGMEVGIIPHGFTLDAYRETIVSSRFLRALVNSIGLTAVHTVLSLLVCVMAAYAFSMKFYGKTVINCYFVITMYFSGGLIPSYLLVAKQLKLYNTYWAILLPGLVSVFYIIIMRSQIEQIPPSLMEAALVDGATQIQVLFYIIVPTIMPTLAAVCMFLVLDKWNSWFEVLVYVRDDSLWTLQYYLRAVVFSKELSIDLNKVNVVHSDVTGENFRMAAIILVALPVVCVYPMVQKYFVKGILVGSVKE